MFRPVLREARAWGSYWRRKWILYWRLRDKGDVAFVAMSALPVIVLGSLIYFAYSNRDAQVSTRLDAALQREFDLRCLAENIHFEGRGESLEGQFAIAEVTMNRLASPHFPKTICEVVHDTRWDRVRRRLVAHFSWTAFEVQREPTGPAWKQAMDVAAAVYDGHYMPVVPGALFYHATYVNPYWASSKRVVAEIGNHIFYR
jgi:spore germination cell wall hydrolase CwlJ-like protein